MKLSRIAQFIDTSLRPSSVCESCGDEFTCGASLAGCWCSEIKLGDSVRARLRERYKGCLCRACLEKFAGNEGEQNGSKEEQVFTGETD